ncbi:MAG: carboxypeptidase-like regulatory domain-containing protein, partial [Longimicrobiales bacterium]
MRRILLGLFVAGCALIASTAAAQTSAITGQLIDERSGLPVRNALVMLVGTQHQTATDEQGWFRLRAIAPGTYRLRVEHIGFGPKVVDARVEAGVPLNLRVTVSETALTLTPLTVEAVSATERLSRSEG